jgi:hypothetical protein
MAETQHTEIGAPTKTCTGCGQTLPATAECFHRHPSGKLGLQSTCRECNNSAKRSYYRSGKGQKALKAYRVKNREAISAYNNSRPPRSETKREEDRRRASQWYRDNKNRAREAHKQWISSPEGKARNRLYQNLYHARRLRHDGEYALRRKTRSAILLALKQGRMKAKGRWWETAVGYTLEELRQHLEQRFTPEMTWENRGKVWEIDHVRPLAGFVIPDTECVAFRQAWSLANLQPLFRADNRAKGGPRRP